MNSFDQLFRTVKTIHFPIQSRCYEKLRNDDRHDGTGCIKDPGERNIGTHVYNCGDGKYSEVILFMIPGEQDQVGRNI